MAPVFPQQLIRQLLSLNQLILIWPHEDDMSEKLILQDSA